jgi:hypothetical protein
MVTPEQKAFRVLQLAKHESVVSFQRGFRRQLNSDPPSSNIIRRWYQQLQTKVCLFKGKCVGRLRVSEESMERVVQTFLCSPKRSVRRTSRELEMSIMTMWSVMQQVKPYHLHLLQFLKPTGHID